MLTSRANFYRLQSVSKAEPTGDTAEPKKPAVYKFRANDGEFDRYNDRLSVKGWKLDDFNANPLILYNHEAGTGFCDDRKALPIGKGRAYVEGDALFVDIEFDQDDEFARMVESKVAKGMLNAVSVRYFMAEGKYRENEKGGYDCDEQTLLEISVVTIPGNQRALRVKAAQDARNEFAQEVIQLASARVVADVMKALDEREARRAESAQKAHRKEAPAEPAPATEEQPQEKAEPECNGQCPAHCPAPQQASAPEASPAPAEEPKSFDAKAASEGLADQILKSLKEKSWS